MKKIYFTFLAFAFLLISCGKTEATPITATKKETAEVITTEEQSSEIEAETSPSAASISKSESTEMPSSEETSEETTGEAIEAFLCGVWQGNDSNVTTIEFLEDHTLYYRELYNKKMKTVEGCSGSWEAVGTGEILLSLPEIGAGYELKGTLTDDQGYLLQCTNGQPWGDEVIYRSSFTHEEIEQVAAQRLAVMLPDGRYILHPPRITAPAIINLPATGLVDGQMVRYLYGEEKIEMTPDSIETCAPISEIREPYEESKEYIGELKKIPVLKGCPCVFGDFEGTWTLTYEEYLQEEIEYCLAHPFSKEWFPPLITITNGEITELNFLP